MIELTRLNGNLMAINSDLIKYVDSTPDTTITLVTGDKLVVLESLERVITLASLYRAHTLRSAWPSADAALTARTACGAAFDSPTESPRQS